MKTFKELLRENSSKEPLGISPEQYKAGLKHGENYDHVHDIAQQHLTGNLDHIKTGERKALQRWTDPDGYKKINGYVRGGNDPQAGELARNLASAVNGHSLPNATWAYRGIHGPHSENLSKLSPGDTFKNTGFASTTLDPNRATHFARGRDVLAVKIPEGHKGLYVSHPNLNHWGSEREMLLPPNTNFKYHGHEDIEAPVFHYTGEKTGETKKIRLHHVEVVPQSDTSIQIDK